MREIIAVIFASLLVMLVMGIGEGFWRESRMGGRVIAVTIWVSGFVLAWWIFGLIGKAS